MADNDFEKLTKENALLKEENQRLKNLLEENGIFYHDEGHAFSKEDKIQVFKSYFHVREDVFEYRYLDYKTNRYSWAIACDRRKSNTCPKKKMSFEQKKNFPCRMCKNNQYTKLDETILVKHFKGEKDVEHGIGVYPILSDDLCYLLAMDFDEERWFDDMLSIYRLAKDKGFSSIMERSFSGQGGHLWFFFQTPVKAYKARKFGRSLLEETMKVNKHLSYASFDRMFPSQDYVPKGGFGNQIALPLCNEAIKKNNSVFITSEQVRYQDQTEALSSVKKITEREIDDFLRETVQEDFFLHGNQLQMRLGLEENYVGEINGIDTNQLYISKRNLNAESVNLIRKATTIWNPAYYEAQRQRKYISREKIPITLSWLEEDKDYYILPRGTKEILKEQMPLANFQLREVFNEGHRIDVTFTGALRPEQEEAVQKLQAYDIGVLKAEPGFGKTVTGINLIAQLSISTLIIVKDLNLIRQWTQSLNRFLNYPDKEKKRNGFIGKFDGTRKKLSGNIDIATAASLANVQDLPSLTKEYGLILVDECQSVPSFTFMTVLKQLKTKRIYGLTATPEREDGLEEVIYKFIGPIRYNNVNRRKGPLPFKKLLLPRYTTITFMKEEVKDTNALLQLLAEDFARNMLITKDVQSAYQSNKKCLVLSKRINHLRILEKMIKDAVGGHAYLLLGSTKEKERKRILDEIRGLKEGPYILLSTVQLSAIGLDIPTLDTLFLTLPITDHSLLKQATGRIERVCEGKERITVYDYLDSEIPIAMHMYQKRLKTYKDNGYLPLANELPRKNIQKTLYEGNSYEKPLWSDIQNAKKSILIFSADYSFKKVYEYHSKIIESHNRGIDWQIVLPKEADNEAIRFLNGAGCHITYQSHRKHFVVIDRSVVWNLSFDFFAESLPKEAYATRIKNDNLVNELIRTTLPKKEEHEGLFALLEE